ncbi:type 1 glutamine amidotransferase domain-containing protein [Bdellovibrio sp. 22V]|uniref:type 1 glutamine amidotransferase domain-containing protein n=1 Tax=Bdellovibrio TaxID=958 RepID=UPI002543DFDF|nr:type 1 glutamine amidotransferase domain-containing protein [Bdellovibrio sp. 22V]WII71993.1 type 1 glutamine amidotransferase domain-containing protein [Bdellovibrio sp. 22V]
MKNKKVLFVLTSTDRLGNTGHKTGAYLSEITHPYDEFVRAGYNIDMISPLGGKVPLDGVKMDDPLNATWMNDEEFLSKVEETLKPWQVDGHDYCAIFFAGGHGTMFDFPENLQLQKLATDVFENNGVVGAVCHGSAGLVNVRLSDGSYLVRGHEISCFTNEEEEAVGMEKSVPFLLQTRLSERGALPTMAPKFTSHVVRSGRLVTGQNPASAAEVGRSMIEVLDFIDEGRILPERNWCEWRALQ